jgi:hypothetical protein
MTTQRRHVAQLRRSGCHGGLCECGKSGANDHTAGAIWHFCQNCEAWPSEHYQEQSVEPPRVLLCLDCICKSEQLKCEIVPEPGIS